MCDCTDAEWGGICPACKRQLPPPVDPAAPYSWHARRGYDAQAAANSRLASNRVQPVVRAFHQQGKRAEKSIAYFRRREVA